MQSIVACDAREGKTEEGTGGRRELCGEAKKSGGRREICGEGENQWWGGRFLHLVGSDKRVSARGYERGAAIGVRKPGLKFVVERESLLNL